MLKFLYTLFIGLLLATCISVGISAFYEAPKAPEYPAETSVYDKPTEPTPADLEKQRQFERESKAYQEKEAVYNRNVSLIAVALALITLAVSLVLLKGVDIIGDGVMLGGVLTLLYGIVRSFGSDEQKFMFAVSLVGLIVALTLGYLKFSKPKVAATATKKRS